MAPYIREANLQQDKEILSDLAGKYLDGGAHEGRFCWLYQKNPFGPARAWIACEKNGEPVGMAAVFPRMVHLRDAVAPACVLGDFCVSPRHRSLGPAVQLQRACLALINSGEFAAAYDFPSTAMLGIYRHLGIHPAGELVRLLKPLRVDRQMERFLPSRILSHPAAVAGNFVLEITEHVSSNPPGVEFRLEETPCESEYSQLADRVGSSVGTCTVRSAEYLNWRYWQHPICKYEFLAARRDGELLAFCTFTTSDGIATVTELFGSMDEQAVPSLLQSLIALLRTRSASAVSLPVLATDPRRGWLRKMGFWAREAVPVIGVAPESTNASLQMFLMQGDRES